MPSFTSKKYQDCPQEIKDQLPLKHKDDVYEEGGIRTVYYDEKKMEAKSEHFGHSPYKKEVKETIRNGMKYFSLIPREHMPCFLCNKETCTAKPGPCPLNKDFQ